MAHEVRTKLNGLFDTDTCTHDSTSVACEPNDREIVVPTGARLLTPHNLLTRSIIPLTG